MHAEDLLPDSPIGLITPPPQGRKELGSRRNFTLILPLPHENASYIKAGAFLPYSKLCPQFSEKYRAQRRLFNTY